MAFGFHCEQLIPLIIKVDTATSDIEKNFLEQDQSLFRYSQGTK